MLLFRRISGTFFIRGISAVASLGLAAIVVAGYSLATFGEFSFALMTVKMVAAISLFSLNSLLLRLLLRSHRGGSLAGRTSIIRACGGMATVVSCAAMVPVLLVALLARQISDDAGFWTSLILLLPIVPLQNILLMQTALLRAERRDTAGQALSVGLPTVLPPLLVGAAFLAGYMPRYLPEAASTLSCLLATLAGVWMSRSAPFLHIGSSLRALARGQFRLLRYSWAMHAANMMNYLADWYGTMLVAASQSMDMTGVLRLIQQFGAAFQLVTTSVEMPLSTEIAKATRNRDYRLMKSLLVRSQVILAVPGLVLTLVAIAAAEQILALFGANSPQAYLALIIFLVLQAGKLFTGAAAAALALINASRRLMLASAIALGFALVGQSLLIPFFGIVGAAAGLGGVVLTRAGINYLFVRRELAERIAKAAVKR